MRKTILTILGSALIVATSVQFAAAAQRHHGKATTLAVIGQQTRHSNTYAAWPAPQVRPYSYPYSGWSAPAGR